MKYLRELVDALLDLDREMQEMVPDSNYSSEYQQKNREWMKLYEGIIYFDFEEEEKRTHYNPKESKP